MDSSKFTLHLIHHTVNSLSLQTTSATTLPTEDLTQNTNDSELFEQKLFDLTEQLSSTGYSQPAIFNNLIVESALVSNQHIAFLLDNGSVCRLNYQFNANNENTNPPVSIQSSSSSSSRSKHSKLSTLSSGLASSLGKDDY